jgi:RimJ/RimL family protein N-acetyltransferase
MSLALNIPVIETERLILRGPQVEDFEPMFAFLSTERSHFVRSAELDRLQAWRGFGHLVGHWVLRGFGQWVITMKGDDTAIGATGGWFPETWPEREIGWAIWSEAHEGQGIAYEAATAARAHLFGAMGWETAVSYIDTANSRSAALAKRLGCVIDPTAKGPNDEPCLVYRHPSQEELHA